MCGIAGVYGVARTEALEAKVWSMLDTQEHRGRGDQGVVARDNYVFGHTRLAIVGDETCVQPFEYEHVCVTYNGEIYNYLDLRTDLISRGHRFKTKGDAEVIAHAYLEYGMLFLERLRGMFAFSLMDTKSNKLYLCRDRVGIKPLYYTQHQGGLYFASEIKALPRNNKVSHEALCEYLNFQYCISNNTLFDSVYKVEAGYYIEFNTPSSHTKRQYWRLGYETVRESNSEYYSETYYEHRLLSLLHSSARNHTPTYVDFGVYASGGLDSSSIASLVSEYAPHLKIVTGRYDEKGFDESAYVDDLVKHLDKRVELYKIDITENEVCDSLEDAIWHMDEPCAGPGLMGQFVTAKLLRQKYPDLKVMMGGQGGDELFGGYARYLIAYLESCMHGAMYPTGKDYVLDLKAMAPLMSTLQGYEPMMSQFFSRGMFGSREERYFNLISRFSSSSVNTDFHSGSYLKNYDAIVNNYNIIFKEMGSVSYFTRMLYFDFKTSLPALLQVDDRVNSAFEIESRVPLLDADIVDFAFRIPPAYKFAGGTSKGIFRKAVAGMLPESITKRTDKMGFPVPTKKWMENKGRFYHLVNDNVNFENDFLKDVFKNLDTTVFDRELWGKLCLGIWAKKFNITL